MARRQSSLEIISYNYEISLDICLVVCIELDFIFEVGVLSFIKSFIIRGTTTNTNTNYTNHDESNSMSLRCIECSS